MKLPRPIALGAILAVAMLVASGGDAQDAEATIAGGGKISFRRDVAPVLALSCTTASCHGGGERPPVLDAHWDATRDATKLRAALVGVASEERPDHAYIVPGAPQASYLVQKIEGRLVDAECADHDCGSAMPLDNPSLSADARMKLRAWIAQGAPNN